MRAIANLLVLFETLKTNSKISLQLNRYVLVFLISCAFLLLLSLLCPWISKLVTYFFPLLVSGALSFTTIYLFILSEKHAAKEMSLVHGGKREDIVVQVCEEANFSMYKDHVEVGCFMLKSKTRSSAEDGWEEDGERVIFAGEVKAGNGDGVLAEDVQSFEIDSMAEGLWNRYFGRYSKWHHIHIDGLVERNVTNASCDDL